MGWSRDGTSRASSVFHLSYIRSSLACQHETLSARLWRDPSMQIGITARSVRVKKISLISARSKTAGVSCESRREHYLGVRLICKCTDCFFIFRTSLKLIPSIYPRFLMRVKASLPGHSQQWPRHRKRVQSARSHWRGGCNKDLLLEIFGVTECTPFRLAWVFAIVTVRHDRATVTVSIQPTHGEHSPRETIAIHTDATPLFPKSAEYKMIVY